MEARTGIPPSFVDVYIEGHRGPDPTNRDILCDQRATEKITRYAEEMRKCHGDYVDRRNAPLDPHEVYEAGGGLPHGRWPLGDGIMVHDGLGRRGSSCVGSSSRSTGGEKLRQTQEELRQTREELRKVQEDTSQRLQE